MYGLHSALRRACTIVPMLLLLACHPAVPPATVWLSPSLSMRRSAWLFADSLYREGWAQRVEKSACIRAWTQRPDGTLVVLRIDPAIPLGADSVTVRYRCPQVADSSLHDKLVPTLHTHLIENGWRYTPSPTDSEVARTSLAPFQILMSDSHVWTVMWKPKGP